MSPPRQLTPEENKLWKQLTEQVVPLRAPLDEEEEEAPLPKPALKKRSSIRVRERIERPPEVKALLTTGSTTALDKRNAERFRKGEMALEAMLDLHGMTYEKANAALARFIETSYMRQKRALLIITGKGTRGEGVLKSALPGWLNHDDIRPMVLAVSPAKAKHGGSGAYYVLLKRKR
ncbi:MAG: Smr/MutS family protein [Alphaproteobacteria bacterium]|nr:Smr/MutS family protein [Alphaproteobacteria bacterium]